MQHDFWHERWQTNQIGFHLSQVNPALVRHREVLGPSAGARVLVPLCGKSVDLVWLEAQGFEVIGVELSPLAVQAFLSEQHREATTDQHGPFQRHRSGGITLLCGDFLALTRELLGRIDAVFDRAALIALPDAMRAAYAQHLTALLAPGVCELLITFEYEPSSSGGPPFSVDDATVRALYGAHFDIERLERVDILDKEPRFKERGITTLHESAYRLVRRA